MDAAEHRRRSGRRLRWAQLRRWLQKRAGGVEELTLRCAPRARGLGCRDAYPRLAIEGLGHRLAPTMGQVQPDVVLSGWDRGRPSRCDSHLSFQIQIEPSPAVPRSASGEGERKGVLTCMRRGLGNPLNQLLNQLPQHLPRPFSLKMGLLSLHHQAPAHAEVPPRPESPIVGISHPRADSRRPSRVQAAPCGAGERPRAAVPCAGAAAPSPKP